MSLSKLGEMVKDRERWRAAVLGIAKSRTRLERLKNNRLSALTETWRFPRAFILLHSQRKERGPADGSPQQLGCLRRVFYLPYPHHLVCLCNNGLPAPDSIWPAHCEDCACVHPAASRTSPSLARATSYPLPPSEFRHVTPWGQAWWARPGRG